MVQREWKRNEVSLKKAFFETSLEPICWVDEWKRQHKINGQLAIVNKDTDEAISVVSSQYNLVRNEDAYKLADYIIRKVFKGLTLQDFECYNVYMPQSKGSCRIDLIIPYTKDNPFADLVDSWTPFVRISNSYNHTLVLKYEIGFCRWICKNGVIFNQKGITISLNHSERIDNKRIEDEIKSINNVVEIQSLMSSFMRKIEKLKSIELPESIALQMYCKAFEIKIDKENITDRQKDILGKSAKRIIDTAKEYFKEMGNNAYAIFNVLTDLATFPVAYGPHSIFIHGQQRKVGAWVDDLIWEADNPDFSLYKYIGEEASNAAFYMESLIRTERRI